MVIVVASSMHFLESLVNSQCLLCLRQSKSGKDYDQNLLRWGSSRYVYHIFNFTATPCRRTIRFYPKRTGQCFTTSFYSMCRENARYLVDKACHKYIHGLRGFCFVVRCDVVMADGLRPKPQNQKLFRIQRDVYCVDIKMQRPSQHCKGGSEGRDRQGNKALNTRLSIVSRVVFVAVCKCQGNCKPGDPCQKARVTGNMRQT